MSLNQLSKAIDQKLFPVAWPGHRYKQRFSQGKGKQKLTSYNPNDGRDLISAENFEDWEEILDYAGKGLQTLRQLDSKGRFDILLAISKWLHSQRSQIIKSLAIETGRPLWDVRLEYQAALEHIEKVLSFGADFDNFLLRMGKISQEKGDFIINPLGITIAYLPFSNPIYSFVSLITAAVIVKCPMIVFSSSHTILTASVFAYLDEELALPAGLLSVVIGDFESFRKLMNDNRVAAVVYHGSREHCQTLIKEKKYTKRQMLLTSGGKNAVLIHSSADLKVAVESVVFGAFKSTGQQSSATSRVFVYRSQLDEFKNQLLQVVRQLSIARTDDFMSLDETGPFMGPLYSAKACEKFLRFQTMASREAKDSWQWGRKLTTEHGGFFVTPGIHFLDKFDDSTSYQGNILFCPDLAVYPYDVLDDAIVHINQTDSPYLVSFIGNPSFLEDRRQQFLAPNLLVNQPTAELMQSHPLVGGFTRYSHRFQDLALSLYLSRPQCLLREAPSQAFRDILQKTATAT